jgi:hypothetical protein
MISWFKRLGDIPGIDYKSPVEVDRESLPGHDAVPRQTRIALFEGRELDRLTWESEQIDDDGIGTSGRSPAQAHAWAPDREELTSEELLARLWEALELPGEPSDYHFAMQSAAGMLWRSKREEPEAVRWCEYLYLLDVRLIEVSPEALANEFATDDGTQDPFYQASAFHSLPTLYEREGFLGEALRIAEIGTRFGQGKERVEGLEERIAAVRAEDGA